MSETFLNVKIDKALKTRLCVDAAKKDMLLRNRVSEIIQAELDNPREDEREDHFNTLNELESKISEQSEEYHDLSKEYEKEIKELKAENDSLRDGLMDKDMGGK